MESTLILVTGPTGVGKSEVAVALAKRYSTDVLSCDSRQFFREMTIGTAVPDAALLREVPHHFIQHISIHDNYSCWQYTEDALKRLDTLFRTRDTVVMAGGSMLYVDAVCHGIDVIPDPDPEIRASLMERYRAEGLAPLLKELTALDPVHAERVDPFNTQRVIHALEVTLTTHRPYSSFLTDKKAVRPFKIIRLGLDLPRAELYDRINARTVKMMEAGLEAEARALYPLRALNALNTVGYKELFACFDGTLSLDEAVAQIQRHTRQYAKKQLTWFRADPDTRWMTPDEALRWER